MALTTLVGDTIDPKSSAAESIQHYYDTILIYNNQSKLVHEQFLAPKRMPSNNGKMFNVRSVTDFATVTAPLVESVTPAAVAATLKEQYFEVKQYGFRSGISDMCEYTSNDPVSNAIVKALSLQMAKSRDTIIRDTIIPSATYDYIPDGASALDATVAATTVHVTPDHCSEMELVLDGIDAEKITSMIPPASGFNSVPVGEAYVAVSSHSVVDTISKFPEFSFYEHYAAGAGKKYSGEIGKFRNTRYIATTNYYSNANSDTAITYFAQNAGVVISLDKLNATSYQTPYGSGDDTLRQRRYFGWKMALGCGLIKQDGTNAKGMAVLYVED